MRRIILESPYAGDVERNKIYARRCMKHALDSGDAPFVSHLLYTQVLDDTDKDERMKGIDAGLCWGPAAGATVVYTDYGVTVGMVYGIDNARKANRIIEFKMIGTNDDPFDKALIDVEDQKNLASKSSDYHKSFVA